MKILISESQSRVLLLYERKEKLKKFLINKLGIDLINSITQITSSYDVPIIFDEYIGSGMVNRYLNFWGPMYLFELDGYKFLYQDRNEFEWFMDEKGFEFVDDEVIEQLGIGEMGLKFSNIINMFFD